jgi:type II secretory pathway pseudopilin PulG
MRTAAQSNGRGFTLIEVLVSFFLLMLIIGVGALSLSAQSDKKKLVEPASEFKALARKGLQLAISNRRPFAIALREDGFALGEANIRVDNEFPGSDDDEGSSSTIKNYQLDDDMRLEVRRWGDKHFRPPDGDSWVFEASGICEPLSVRLYHPAGVIEMEFNPLTAKVAEQSLVLGEENIDDF